MYLLQLAFKSFLYMERAQRTRTLLSWAVVSWKRADARGACSTILNPYCATAFVTRNSTLFQLQLLYLAQIANIGRYGEGKEPWVADVKRGEMVPGARMRNGKLSRRSAPKQLV
jgi:hypothetical protein